MKKPVVGDDEANEGSDEEDEVGVAHDTRLHRSLEDIRMENVSFTESAASECKKYYTDSSYYSPIETTSDEDDASHLAILLTARKLISTIYFLKKRKLTAQPN
jgi:hypothetical protein